MNSISELPLLIGELQKKLGRTVSENRTSSYLGPCVAAQECLQLSLPKMRGAQTILGCWRGNCTSQHFLTALPRGDSGKALA